MQVEVHPQLNRWRVGSHAHFGASSGVTLSEHREVVRPGRDAFKRERSVGLRRCLPSEFIELYRSAAQRSGVQRIQ